jgi:cation transport regulator ChaB
LRRAFPVPAHVQEFHRLLFATASDSFRQEIARIVGTEIREAAAEVAAEAVAHVFTTGTVVQVFLLSQRVPTDIWSGSAGQF